MAAIQFQIKPCQSPSDCVETPITKEYHEILIGMLSKENPFRAVRLATEFNKENGFELIPVAYIRKWKRAIAKGSKMDQLEAGYRLLLGVENKL